jgi:hypothetical protein
MHERWKISETVLNNKRMIQINKERVMKGLELLKFCGYRFQSINLNGTQLANLYRQNLLFQRISLYFFLRFFKGGACLFSPTWVFEKMLLRVLIIISLDYFIGLD